MCVRVCMHVCACDVCIRLVGPVMPWALVAIDSSCFIKGLSLSCVACAAVNSGQ